MATFRTPVAAYRLQFNQDFTFREATGLLDYFQQLGITDIYASPLLQSRRGSGHGYDVADSTRLDTDAGPEVDFEAFHAELERRGMGLILDIVPNHMAASSENPWWMDVLENGPASPYASHFDIDWHPPSRTLENKVLLPVLGNPYGRVLEDRELKLIWRNGVFMIQYHQELFPLAPASYRRVLKHRLDVLEKRLGHESASCQEYRGILAGLAALPERDDLTADAAGERRLQVQAIKDRLRRLYDADPAVRAFVTENLRLFQGKKGRPASFRLLDRLLAEQAFVLAFWQNPNEVINYRRFFTITDLVGVRVEDPFVFEATHNVILRLVEREVVSGLRIDHIDGLRDPLGYLQRLQESVGRPPEHRSFYVMVEKILASSEDLPRDWPVAGTTGYDFLNALNRLFVDPRGVQHLHRIYTRFLEKDVDYEAVLYQKKKLVMATLLAVEMRSLGRQLDTLAEQDRYARDLPRTELTQALIETTAWLSVYRTYVREIKLPAEAKAQIGAALERARAQKSHLNQGCFDFVRDVLLLEDRDHLLPEQREARLGFVMRWQQFTSPIVAKGLEDTTLYVFNPLISLNEVGGDPGEGMTTGRDFHEFLERRARSWPHTLNATTTHDTKRAEDARARINVLSEIPRLWTRHLNRWARLNAGRRLVNGHHESPDRNEEIFFYQTLLGTWPLSGDGMADLKERLQAYVVKATREAMVHTRWTLPNLEHEGALTSFVASVVEGGRNSPFIRDFARFQEKVAYYGMLNGLAQTLLKIACPGVPDFYQGSELWDFRLVDPDNRGRVDFPKRVEMLRSVREEGASPSPEYARRLWAHWQDSRIKLYVIWKALNFRREHAALFLDGDYLRVPSRGKRKEHVFAFARSEGTRRVLAATPRWLARAGASMHAEDTAGFWGTSHLILPSKAPKRWHNLFTGEEIDSDRQGRHQTLALRDLFRNFPVALLCSFASATAG
jgi:(1->4)-alpha-D-glucan 1-alpha-D-glucosylmutase